MQEDHKRTKLNTLNPVHLDFQAILRILELCQKCFPMIWINYC